MDRPFLPIAVCAVLVGALSALGCTPSIGDDCSSSTDCSLRGDRLCDTTQPGGYCTIFNCEPNNCPSEAQCVAFNSQVDPVCIETVETPRFQRTFCMFRCSGNSDCRGGYVCLDTAQQPNAWGALVVDTAPEGVKICVAAGSTALPGTGNPELCRPFDGSFPDVEYFKPDVTENVDVATGDVALDQDGAEVSEADSADAPESDVGPDVDSGPDAADAGPDVVDAGPDVVDAGPDVVDASDAADVSVQTDAGDATVD